MVCDSLGRRGVWERLDTWICRVESLPCSPETITTLLISYRSTQNKELKKKKEIQLKKNKHHVSGAEQRTSKLLVVALLLPSFVSEL